MLGNRWTKESFDLLSCIQFENVWRRTSFYLKFLRRHSEKQISEVFIFLLTSSKLAWSLLHSVRNLLIELFKQINVSKCVWNAQKLPAKWAQRIRNSNLSHWTITFKSNFYTKNKPQHAKLFTSATRTVYIYDRAELKTVPWDHSGMVCVIPVLPV